MRKTPEASSAKPFQVRLASEADHEALVSFGASFEAAHLPPASEGWSLDPPAFVLMAIQEGTLVAALRVEMSRRARITHLLVSPSVEGQGIGVMLLEGGMMLARKAGAVTLGGYLPAGSPLILIAQELGAQLKACFLWVEGPLEPAEAEPTAESSSLSTRPRPGTGHQETSR